MAQQVIDVGTSASDGTGDPLRDAFTKVNDNFTELYSTVENQGLTYGNIASNVAGITFNVTRYTESYQATPVLKGTGQVVGNVYLIRGNVLGGSTPVNDVYLTVTTLANATVGNIATVSAVGIPLAPVLRVNGLSGNVTLTVTNIEGAASKAYVNAAVSANIANVAGAVTDSLRANITAANAVISNHTSRITTLESNAATQAGQINNLVSVKANTTYVDTSISLALSSNAILANVDAVNANVAAANAAILLRANLTGANFAGNITSNNILSNYTIRATTYFIAGTEASQAVGQTFANPAAIFYGNSAVNDSPYYQINLQNIDPNGSGDIVVTADDGSDFSNFIGFGMSGSNNLDPDFPALLPHDGYLYVTGGNLVLQSNTHSLDFIAGNLSASQMRLTTANVLQLRSNLVIQFPDGTVQSTAFGGNANVNSINANITAANIAIASLQSNSASQALELDQLVANASVQAAGLTVLSSNAATQAVLINSINSNIAAANTNILDLTNSIASTNANLTAANVNITSLLANATTQALDLDNLQSNAQSQQSSIILLQANSVSQATEINLLNANIVAANVNIATLTSNAASQAIQINLINANVTAANTKISTLEANAASQTQQLDNLVANAGSQATTLNTLTANAGLQSENISTLNANITAANTRIITIDANLGVVSTNVFALSVNVGSYQIYSNANSASQASSINNLYSNIGAFQTFANLNYGTNGYSNVIAAAYLLNNTVNVANLITSGGVYWANGAAYVDEEVRASLGEYQTYANANAATQATSIDAIVANVVAYQTYANATFSVSSFGNANVKTYLGQFDGNIIPNANITYDLGSSDYRWRDLWLSGNTINIGAATISANGSAIALPVGSTIAGTPIGQSTYSDSNVKTYLESLSNVNIGLGAGLTSQGNSAVAIGNSAGKISQGIDSIAIGAFAGNSAQGDYAVAIGHGTAANAQGTYAVAIGWYAGETTQGTEAVAIGDSAGSLSQGAESVAVGYVAGYDSQSQFATAIGAGAGYSNQSSNAVAVGYDAAAISQGTDAVAIGRDAGRNNQSTYAVAIGRDAGKTTQGNNSVSIGYTAGQTTQGSFAVAIGDGAGRTNQGNNAIAIGEGAGLTNQANNSIIISANGILNSTTSGFFVDPVRNLNSGNVLVYNPSTKEITFDISGNLTYTMANYQHWTSNVSTVAAALDQLASRIWAIENP